MTHYCPLCGLPAEVVERFTLDSTDGPVPHVFIRCFAHHSRLTLAEEVTVDDDRP